ncbi:hypothetical protein HOY34_00675 [Xinfangfangia sp. D13-10-4-6]|uniref:hypothetical protein n=1 Tax=Pseudogemmobacter hezensis TaxID=2737662 RepID=UPI001554FF8B|nr:hypothetical protein [Pseudogemmobacter hezensis]NPD13714.1 hypothetical protein [Pseudogemmobacter hezensis]
MIAVFARILARYIAGALVAVGVIDAGLGETLAIDPELALFLGAILGAGVEGTYALARRFGWQR